MKVKWLERAAIVTPYLGLATSQKRFEAYLKDIGFPGAYGPFVAPGANATTHTYSNEDGDLCCLVCISDFDEQDPVQVASLLVHEAVHVWQRVRENMRERDPSPEFEAYSVQAIAQNLMFEFRRQVTQGRGRGSAPRLPQLRARTARHGQSFRYSRREP